MSDLKRYDLLEEKFDYDHDAATQLAEATTELVAIQRRARYLRDIIKRHGKLRRFLWGTAEGRVIAMHDLDDSHLANILTYLPAQGREPSRELLAEVRSRGLAAGNDNGLASLSSVASDTEIIFETYDEEDE